jgi:RHS repeat-associated protein
MVHREWGGALTNLVGEYAFAGREWDGDAGFYYNRARWYDANSDPLSFAGGDANLYRYAAGDPVNFRDPSGQFAFLAAALTQFAVSTAVAGLDSAINGNEFTLGVNVGIGFGGEDLSDSVDINGHPAEISIPNSQNGAHFNGQLVQFNGRNIHPDEIGLNDADWKGLDLSSEYTSAQEELARANQYFLESHMNDPNYYSDLANLAMERHIVNVEVLNSEPAGERWRSHYYEAADRFYAEGHPIGDKMANLIGFVGGTFLDIVAPAWEDPHIRVEWSEPGLDISQPKYDVYLGEGPSTGALADQAAFFVTLGASPRGLVSVPRTAGAEAATSSVRQRVLANIAESQQARASSNFGTYVARENQILSGYSADVWLPTTLQPGSIVYGGVPGQSAYYMDFATVRASELNAQSLFESLQVAPHPVYGYRPRIQAYRVSTEITVPGGRALNNPAFGSGGGGQYFIPNYDDVLIPIRQFPLSK